ncbi:MAG TPA: gliding motility-associated C-terminal domain-containing protein, partial [Hanamia sp.]|nr:gliding motility-associated C-terminal domain-containing protein [Hanamia sp.]
MKLLLFILFIISFPVRLLSQLPPCKDSFPKSLLLNNSFEEYSGCGTEEYGGNFEGGFIDGPVTSGGIKVDDWHSFTVNTWEVRYFNFDCGSKQFNSIFDTTAFLQDQPCSYGLGKVPMPLPAGNGFIAITENDAGKFVKETSIVKNYITSCLSQPLYAGQKYLLTFYFGFGTSVSTTCPRGYPHKSQSPYTVAIFGRQDCPGYPLRVPPGSPELMGGCLTNSSGWVQLGTATLKGNNEWVTAAIEFTPQTNIACIGIGPDCSNHSFDPDFYYTYSLHYMDKLVLAPIADFSFRNITAVSGDVCNGHFVLKAPPYLNSTYQWYKDQVLIPGAKSETYTVPDKPEAEGNYVVNIGRPYNTCLNSLPFSVKFSSLKIFTLGNDTTLCEPSSITLNAKTPDATSYLWQNGSTDETQQVDSSGQYWVRLTDEYGCVKHDSINIKVQVCENCRLFIPSAFTPNGDGLNDVFETTPQCKYIGLTGFDFQIYNRWGQLVFRTNDMHKGWDGKYK